MLTNYRSQLGERRKALPCCSDGECGMCVSCCRAAIAAEGQRNRLRVALTLRQEAYGETWAAQPVGPLYTQGEGGSIHQAEMVAGSEEARRRTAGRVYPNALNGPPAQPVVLPVSPRADACIFHRVPPKALLLKPDGLRWFARIGQFDVLALTDTIALSALRRKVITAAWAARHRGVRYYGERAGLRQAGVKR